MAIIKGYRQSYYHMLRSHINDHTNDRDKSYVSCNIHVPDAVLSNRGPPRNWNRHDVSLIKLLAWPIEGLGIRLVLHLDY